jgi:alkylation response protein AidB-like acyl-CoA dehydrogenase
MAKKFVPDSCVDVASKALQLHGGCGYLAECGLERIVRVHRSGQGTKEIMRAVFRRSLLGSAA